MVILNQMMDTFMVILNHGDIKSDDGYFHGDIKSDDGYFHGDIKSDDGYFMANCSGCSEWYFYLFIYLFVIYLKLTNLQNHCINNTIKNSQNKIG